MAGPRAATLALACVSLLYLRLPGSLSGGLGRAAGGREPSAQTPSSGPRHSAPRPVFWKPRQVPHPHGKASLASSMGRPLHSGHRRPSSPRRPHAQLLRVGCMLGTCQVQNLSYRLWQLAGPAGRRDSAPVDPSSPHSYG